MTLYKGFVQGLIKYDDNGTYRTLPFDTFIENATLNVTSESLEAETFNDNGIKSISSRCTIRQMAEVTLESTDITKTFLQAATNTLIRDAELPRQKTISVVLADVVATESVYTIPDTPLVGTDVIVTDVNSVEYAVTVAGSVLTFDADYTGTRVTITYTVAASGTLNEIAIGSGAELGEVGLYGVFKGCGQDILLTMNRASIDANLSMAVGTDAATASMIAKGMRDINGNIAILTYI